MYSHSPFEFILRVLCYLVSLLSVESQKFGSRPLLVLQLSPIKHVDKVVLLGLEHASCQMNLMHATNPYIMTKLAVGNCMRLHCAVKHG